MTEKQEPKALILAGITYCSVPVKFVIQREHKGVVHAMECCWAARGGADFILRLANEFFINSEHTAFLRFFLEKHVFAACGVIHVDDLIRIGKTYGRPGGRQVVSDLPLDRKA